MKYYHLIFIINQLEVVNAHNTLATHINKQLLFIISQVSWCCLPSRDEFILSQYEKEALVFTVTLAAKVSWLLQS